MCNIIRTVIVAVVLAGVVVVSGCAKDPQVLVTPFVLKPVQAQPLDETVAVEGGEPASRIYEESLIQNAAR